jgi:hypothetical protein
MVSDKKTVIRRCLVAVRCQTRKVRDTPMASKNRSMHARKINTALQGRQGVCEPSCFFLQNKCSECALVGRRCCVPPTPNTNRLHDDNCLVSESDHKTVITIDWIMSDAWVAQLDTMDLLDITHVGHHHSKSPFARWKT